MLTERWVLNAGERPVIFNAPVLLAYRIYDVGHGLPGPVGSGCLGSSMGVSGWVMTVPDFVRKPVLVWADPVLFQSLTARPALLTD